MKKIVTLGEIMLRFSTNIGERLSQTNSFSAYYGGAEANVGVSLAHFGYQVYFVSKVPNNPLGLAVEHHLKAHGVNADYIVKGGERLGTYYVESGVGERSPHVTYDRKYSSFSEIKMEELDFEEIFTDVSLFHVSGITLALSPELQDLTLKAMKLAKEKGILTSFDFNYREKLWSLTEAANAIRPLLPFIDICSCGELDAIHILGINETNPSLPKEERLNYYYGKMKELYPNIKYMCSTFRDVISASTNTLQGNFYVNGELYQSKVHHISPIVDRIGGGDAFMSGVLYGIAENILPEKIVSFATAASALKHTIHGDCNTFSSEEVFRFAENTPGKIIR